MAAIPKDGRRWGILGVMFLANAMPEFLWSNFPPIMTQVAARFGAGPTVVGLLIESFSIGTVLAAGFAGRLIDSRGYRAAVLIGLAGLAVFSIIRALPAPFWLVVVAQAGIGATLPFITGATSSFVVDWFEPSQESRVTGICMVGLFSGLAASMVFSPWAAAQFGFEGLMQITAAMAIGLFFLAWPLMRERGLTRQPKHGLTHDTGLRWIRGNRALWVLLLSSFLAQGTFSAIAAGLELVWHKHGFSSSDAGMANAIFIVGATVGSLLLPIIQDRFGNGRALLIGCYIAPLVLTYPLFAATSLPVGIVFAALLGVFWLGNLPVSLTLLQQAVGPTRAGIASSLYWGYGNAGVIVLVGVFNGLLEYVGWEAAVTSMIVLSAGTLGLTLLLPKDGGDKHR